MLQWGGVRIADLAGVRSVGHFFDRGKNNGRNCVLCGVRLLRTCGIFTNGHLSSAPPLQEFFTCKDATEIIGLDSLRLHKPYPFRAVVTVLLIPAIGNQFL